MKSVTMRFLSGMSAILLAILLTTAMGGCKSKQDAAIEQAKQTAATTGQAQQVVATDSNGNTTTTVVQPPVPGQSGQVVTTTVTPKVAAGTDAQTAAGGQPAGAGQTQPGQAAVAPAPLPGSVTSGPVAQTLPPPAPDVHVAAGTPLTIRIDQRISAKGNRAGDRFTGEIVEPVLDGNGNTIIPKGARVGGVVDLAHRRGHFKGAANLELRLTTLTLDGRELPLETADMRERKKGKGRRSAAFIGGATGLGMLIGGVASGGMGVAIGGAAGAGAGTAVAGLTGNGDLVIPAESIVHFKLADDLVIQP